MHLRRSADPGLVLSLVVTNAAVPAPANLAVTSPLRENCCATKVDRNPTMAPNTAPAGA